MSKQKKPKRQDLDGNLCQINLNAAGIDIGADRHWVSVPVGRDSENVRSFACFTADLYAMADWLKQCCIETVAMESTGVYWIPVFQVLESRGFDVKLVNAHYVKTVPGPKTDVLTQVASYRFRRSLCAIKSPRVNKNEGNMLNEIITVYAIIDDLLKAIRHREDCRRLQE